MPKIDFEYDISDHVTVKAIEMHGRVDSLSYDATGKMYRVVYWHNGERYTQWMYSWEIQKRKFKEGEENG